jgi:hypothetical protein
MNSTLRSATRWLSIRWLATRLLATGWLVGTWCLGNLIFAVVTSATVIGQETQPAVIDDVFSGPQIGEALPEFVFRELLVDSNGQERNLVREAAEGPLLLVFVHEVNRPSIGFTRALTGYAHSRARDGLRTAVIFLDADATTAETNLRRIQHALTAGVLTGVSLDGQEGPGSYGLHRQVELTILIAKDKVVTGNFALIQPSLPVDLPKVMAGIVEVVGGTVPPLSELEGGPAMREPRPAGDPTVDQGGNQPPNLRPLLQPMLRKNATPEQVDEAAAKVEQAANQDEAFGKELGRACKTIVDAGVLSNYGTAKTQEYFRQWAEKYGQKKLADEPAKR